MPRRPHFVGDFIYHIVNRAAKRTRLFDGEQDYNAVHDLLSEVRAATAMRLLTYCIMPNHWHLILWPSCGLQLSQFMQLFTGTHAQRWHAAHSSTGDGAVYQGRYKAFPIQSGGYFINACRYVERNPLRAGLVHRAEDWRWSSCWQRLHPKSEGLLEPWPIARPTDWLRLLNADEPAKDLEEIRTAVCRGIPLGDRNWVAQTAITLGVESRLRRPGRPKKNLALENPSRPLFT